MKVLKSRSATGTHLSTVIPDGYNKKRICILSCNPAVLYIYWELPPEYHHPSNQLYLRISSFSLYPNDNEEIEVLPLVTRSFSLYYTLPNLKTNFLFELQEQLEDGTLETVCSTTHSTLNVQMQQVPESTALTPPSQSSAEKHVVSLDSSSDTPILHRHNQPVQPNMHTAKVFTLPSSWIHSSS